MAWKLVVQAFRMIFNNFGQALRVSIGPYLLLVLAFFVIVTAFAPSMIDGAGATGTPPSGLAMLLLIALIPLTFFISSWVAVSWHRFILLEEYTVVLPAVSGRPIWPYVGKSIMLGLFVILISIPIMFVIGGAAMPAMSSASGGLPVFAIAVLACGYVLIGFIALRWAVALPSVALGKPMGFGEAWNVTKPISGAIFGVTVILVLINVLPGMLLTGVYAFAPLLAFVIDIALSWLTLMLGIGVLTTLYGHLVEGRDLPA